MLYKNALKYNRRLTKIMYVGLKDGLWPPRATTEGLLQFGAWLHQTCKNFYCPDKSVVNFFWEQTKHHTVVSKDLPTGKGGRRRPVALESTRPHFIRWHHSAGN